MHFKYTLILILMFLLVNAAHAYDVKFNWLKNTENSTGYILHFREGASYTVPFNDVGLNNNEPKFISTTVAHNPDILVFHEIKEDRGYMLIDGLSPTKSYSFALTAYNEGICSQPTEEKPEVGTIVTREDGTTYCESKYSDIVFVPKQPIPFIRTFIFDT